MALTSQDKQEIRQLIREEIEENNTKVEGMIQNLKDFFYNLIDPILKEVVSNREERTIISHKISEHEDRITKLEQTSV